jgi:hypothetical protein
MLALGLDAPDEHGDVRALPATVSVKLVEDEEAEILENGISNGPLLHPSK